MRAQTELGVQIAEQEIEKSESVKGLVDLESIRKENKSPNTM